MFVDVGQENKKPPNLAVFLYLLPLRGAPLWQGESFNALILRCFYSPPLEGYAGGGGVLCVLLRCHPSAGGIEHTAGVAPFVVVPG